MGETIEFDKFGHNNNELHMYFKGIWAASDQLLCGRVPEGIEVEIKK